MTEETEHNEITNWGERNWCAYYGLSPKNGLGEGRPLDLTGFPSILVADLDHFVAHVNEIYDRVTKLIEIRGVDDDKQEG
jgi:hypothetical protein